MAKPTPFRRLLTAGLVSVLLVGCSEQSAPPPQHTAVITIHTPEVNPLEDLLGTPARSEKEHAQQAAVAFAHLQSEHFNKHGKWAGPVDWKNEFPEYSSSSFSTGVRVDHYAGIKHGDVSIAYYDDGRAIVGYPGNDTETQAYETTDWDVKVVPESERLIVQSSDLDFPEEPVSDSTKGKGAWEK